MKYPRIDPKHDRRRKLMPRDYVAIKRLHYALGWSKAALARKYKVAHITITRVLDPDFRKKENDRKNKWNKKNREHVEELKKPTRIENQRYLRKVGGGKVQKYYTHLHRESMKDPEFRARQYKSIYKSRAKKHENKNT